MTQSTQKIFLIGFMGSGKTFWGTRLAAHLGWSFLDLDAVIEGGEGASIPSIFEQAGEAEFRLKEQHYLHQVASTPENIVVSTGGGAPCFFDNIDRMNVWGTTIYIRLSADQLAARLWPERLHRPLLSNVQEANFSSFIQEKLSERAPFYEQAQIIINRDKTDELDFLTKLAAEIETNP